MGNAEQTRAASSSDHARFRLAQSDMRQVIAAADALLQRASRRRPLSSDRDGRRRLLRAAVFESNAIGAIGHKWPPLKEAPRPHRELLRLRKKVYAHTDKTDARQVIDVSNIIAGFEDGSFTERRHPTVARRPRTSSNWRAALRRVSLTPLPSVRHA